MRIGLGLHITGLRAGGEAAPFALASFFSGAASSDAITHTRAGNATMVDSDGLLKWAPHNLLLWSQAFDNAVWTKTPIGNALAASVTPDQGTAPSGSGADRAIFDLGGNTASGDLSTLRQSVTVNAQGTFEILVRSFDGVSSYNMTLSAGGAEVPITVTGDWQLFTGTATTSGGITPGIYLRGARSPANSDTADVLIADARIYRSDLGGMVDNPGTGDSYVPTTSAAVYLPRRGHHIYDGAAWVNEGLLHESEARTNLLHTTDALVTQSLTVTNTPHTLHFTGTGTVTLSGASTAGPLVGTGTGENNRVSLTFTPTAGSLTLTVSGTVTNAQLEEGSTLSSHIPNLAASGSVIRAADTLTIPAANLPWSSDAVSIQMQGRMTYADTGIGVADDGLTGEVMFASWRVDSSNYIALGLSTGGSATGQPVFLQEASGVFDFVNPAGSPYSPGVNVPFNIASRHGSTFINGAVDGTALTADLTPTALPDLSATDLSLGFVYNGTIKQFRMWGRDIGDTGIAEESA